MRNENGFYIDENHNRWDSKLYNEFQAKLCSESLINCFACLNCIDCINCTDCKQCVNCTNSVSCTNCYDIICCKFAISSQLCSNSNWITNCRNLFNISKVSNFNEMPKIFESCLIGSRKAVTQILFTKTHEIVKCGCFAGTIEEFKTKVYQKYSGIKSGHVLEYMNFLKMFEETERSK